MEERTKPYERRGRCVECGLIGVTPGDACKDLKAGHATLDLPAGKTCGDCYAFRHCAAFFGRIAADESCDFFPVRFAEAPKAASAQ